jgi:hypothetical protein
MSPPSNPDRRRARNETAPITNQRHSPRPSASSISLPDPGESSSLDVVSQVRPALVEQVFADRGLLSFDRRSTVESHVNVTASLVICHRFVSRHAISGVVVAECDRLGGSCCRTQRRWPVRAVPEFEHVLTAQRREVRANARARIPRCESLGPVSKQISEDGGQLIGVTCVAGRPV